MADTFVDGVPNWEMPYIASDVVMSHHSSSYFRAAMSNEGTSVSRATSISRASKHGSTASRNQSLIKKNVAPHDLRPSDVLIERFVAWKAILKQLIAYFEVWWKLNVCRAPSLMPIVTNRALLISRTTPQENSPSSGLLFRCPFVRVISF